MKYAPLDEVKRKADVTVLPPTAQQRRTIRRERLELFAKALERYSGPMRLFSRIEYLSTAEQSELRTENSPLTIAFNDPVLRTMGLKSDRLGDASEFFELSADEVHQLLCDCHYAGPVGGQISSRMLAGRVRWIAKRLTFAEMWDRTRAFFRL